MQFKKIESGDDVKNVAKTAFGLDFDISGNWGYDKASATNILSLDKVEKEQFEFTLVSMRAHIEMNMTLGEDERYGGINPSEVSRETINIDNNIYDKVNYTILAIKEKPYKKLMKEYKDNYGKSDFDLAKHFNDRNTYSIEIPVEYWFHITKISENL
jgi:hypothetical protein